MTAAGAGIEPVGPERIRRTDRQTGFFPTGIARARRLDARRQFDSVAEQQGGSVNMPETEFRMKHDPYGRSVDGLRPGRPILHRHKGRAVIGKYRKRIHLGGNALYFRAEPAIQRIASLPVGMCLERLPDFATRIADQQDRRSGAAIGERRDTVRRDWLKTAAHEQAGMFQKIIQSVDHPPKIEPITRVDANVIGRGTEIYPYRGNVLYSRRNSMTAITLPHPSRRILMVFALAFALLAAAGLMRPAAAANIWFEGGLLGSSAVRGYDVVAYFTEGKPVEGKSDYTHEWSNTTWRFASAAHRDLFAANPEKYAPQYGGWCAWAVSQGYTASIDPAAWRIVDGKLYLNYSKSVQSQWAQNIPGFIAKGDTNWPRLKQKLAVK